MKVKYWTNLAAAHNDNWRGPVAVQDVGQYRCVWLILQTDLWPVSLLKHASVQSSGERRFSSVTLASIGMTTDAAIYLYIYFEVAISSDEVTTETSFVFWSFFLFLFFLKKTQCILIAEYYRNLFFFLRNKPEEVHAPLVHWMCLIGSS